MLKQKEVEDLLYRLNNWNRERSNGYRMLKIEAYSVDGNPQRNGSFGSIYAAVQWLKKAEKSERYSLTIK